MQNFLPVAGVTAAMRGAARRATASVALSGVVLTGVALAGALVSAQTPSSIAQPAAPASLNDSLLARATALYDSTAKSGLHGFDCQVHPDWKTIMSSSRRGAAVAEDDPRLALVSMAKMTLHARIAGGSTLDWQTPTDKPLSPSDQALLEHVHQGIEKSLQGVLKVWIPLVDGSVAESLGEEAMITTATDTGYTVRSRDNSLIEEFDRGLLLTRFESTTGGATADIAPNYKPGVHGLQLTGFKAHLSPAGAPESAQQMDVSVEYQTIAGVQIPAAFNIDMANVVTMNFKLDGCTLSQGKGNPENGKQGNVNPGR